MYKDWVPHPKETRCLRVKGTSMHPVLPDGSLVAVDGAIREPAQCADGIVAARVDDGVVIKWLTVAKDVLMLRSENREFAPVVLHPSEDEPSPIVGKVIWSLTRWLPAEQK